MSHNLEQWFLTEFSTEELKQIEQKITLPKHPLIKAGDVLTRNYVKHLHMIAGHFINQPTIAERLLNKGLMLLSTNSYTPLDAFFLYSESVRIFYKNNNLPTFKEKTIEACLHQIKLSPHVVQAFQQSLHHGGRLPVHNGYNQLTSMLEQDKKYDHAIALCQQAMKQGWPANWTLQIMRCRQSKDTSALQQIQQYSKEKLPNGQRHYSPFPSLTVTV